MKKEKVLIVDDNEMNCKLLSVLLRNESFNIIYAYNGKDAVFKCLTEPIDLVLMDLNMPEMDGLEAGRRIREFNRDVPIILQTAYTYELNKIKNLHSVFNIVLTKPIIPKRLIEKIKILLYNNKNIAC